MIFSIQCKNCGSTSESVGQHTEHESRYKYDFRYNTYEIMEKHKIKHVYFCVVCDEAYTKLQQEEIAKQRNLPNVSK